jgi:hypothetical protein
MHPAIVTGNRRYNENDQFLRLDENCKIRCVILMTRVVRGYPRSVRVIGRMLVLRMHLSRKTGYILRERDL